MLSPDLLDAVGLTPEGHLPRRASNISQALRAIDRESLALPDPHKVVVRPVRSGTELDEVYRITHDAYAERGYCKSQPGGRLIHYPHFENLPETTVLVAIQERKVMGTVSLTLDGPRGLQSESEFKAECGAVRAEGGRIACIWRIATRQSLRGERHVVMALIGEVVSYAFDILELDTFLCTFNPRHERIYARLLNMRVIARSEGSEGLQNAPGVLMRCDRASVPEKWLKKSSRYRPRMKATSRS